jgi:signal transduction histidine kinase
VGVLTLISFAFFAFVPLPAAYYSNLPFGRPEEFVSAVFFLLALIGFLRKGAWKTEAFEHWVVLSLIVGLVCQIAFMSSSFRLFDSMFDVAHLLKKVSCLCVLTGLLISLTDVLLQAERDKVELRVHRDRLLEHTVALEKANRELSEYDHFVAHDLRAPLRGIRQYADFLKDDLEGKLEGDQLEYLEGLMDSTAKADSLVSDLSVPYVTTCPVVGFV